jgi:hypothetical protein
MPYEDIPRARNDALPASFAKPFAQHKPSQSKLRNEKMAAGGPLDMILT